MAAKGSILKQEITKKILEAFPGSFLYNDGKEIRINGSEAGMPLQIKVTLTAAKEAVENDNIVITSSAGMPIKDSLEGASEIKTINPEEKFPTEPTEEEKENLKKLLASLGM